MQDDTQFPCIASKAIPCSTSYTKGGLTSFMELQRFPRNTVTSLEEPRGHRHNPKELHVPQIILRIGPMPLLHVEMNAVFHRHVKRMLLSAVGM